MNSQVSLTYLVLWIAHPILQSAVALAMWRTKAIRRHPVFFTYIIAEIIMFVVCFPVFEWGSYASYFYSYWTFSLVSLALGFFVIREVFGEIFRPFLALRDLGSVLFTWAGFVMLMVAAVVAAASPSSHSPIVDAVTTLQRCVRVIQCGLILFLLVFSKYLGVTARRKSFGIMLGFGGYALVELATVALFAAGRIADNGVSLTIGATYNAVILVWFVYFGLMAKEAEEPRATSTSQRWNESLSDIQHPGGVDSLIPMFEGMVDQAFSRSKGLPTPDGKISEKSLWSFKAAASGTHTKNRSD